MLSTHARCHIADFQCSICFARCKDKKSLQRHYSSHSQNLVRCTVLNCDTEFVTSEGMKYHLASHHSYKFQMRCNVCKHQFVDEISLKLHEANHMTFEPPARYNVDDSLYVKPSKSILKKPEKKETLVSFADTGAKKRGNSGGVRKKNTPVVKPMLTLPKSNVSPKIESESKKGEKSTKEKTQSEQTKAKQNLPAEGKSEQSSVENAELQKRKGRPKTESTEIGGTCNKCDAYFKDKYNISRHKKKTCPRRDIACPNCQEICEGPSGLKAHCQLMHGVDVDATGNTKRTTRSTRD